MAAPSPLTPPSLLLLRDLSTHESDFARTAVAPSNAHAVDSNVTRAVLHVSGVVAATAGVGFVEACLHFERRPIPLRFAVRYALANVLPSVVWKSVSADVVAAASNVARSSLITSMAPLSSAITPSAGSAAPVHSLSAARAKQLVVLKSVRSVRQFLGSYALAWSLWHAFGHFATAPDSTDNSTSSTKAPAMTERVVRLAPDDSALSRASRRRHGEHIATIPLSASASNKPHASALAIDWRTLGLARATRSNAQATAPPTLQVLEVELNDSASVANARRVLQKAVYDLPDEQLQSVAVLPPQPLAVAALDAFDVCVRPLAAVLHALASVCASTRESPPLLLVPVDEDDGEASESLSRALSADVARGLLYQHGLVTTRATLDDVLSMHDHEDDDVTRGNERSHIVIVVATSAADGRAAARRLIASGAALQEDVVVVCEESAQDDASVTGALRRLPALLLQPHASNGAPFAPAAVLSLADTGDALLQRVRELLRSGHSADAIQCALFSAFGPQKTLQRRRDALSDLDRAFN